MHPFRIDWQDADIAALLQLVADCPVPEMPDDAGWEMGCDRAFLERFREHWIAGYDWKAALDELHRYPHFLANLDGLDIHYVHIKAGRGVGRALLLTHGWPGSFYEFWNVADRLAKQGFDLVIPSLPGYAFSGKPRQPIGPQTTARLWARLMSDVLGYKDYIAQGGDWGALVTSHMGLNSPPGLRAIHLNMLGVRNPEPSQNEEERLWATASGEARARLGAYSGVQMSKPSSLAWLGAGNPLGQAAWILERFHDWSDLREQDFEQVFSMDHLVTSVMLYAMTNSFSSSLWFYHGLVREGQDGFQQGRRCALPTGFAAYPGDSLMPRPPHSRVARCFNLVHWSEPGLGGHFAAMEQPERFANDFADFAQTIWNLEDQ